MEHSSDQIQFLEKIKTIAIIAMFSDDRLMEELVLKGGNAIDIAYRMSGRASEDLDFSMGDDFESEDSLRTRIERCLVKTFNEHGHIVFDVTLKAVPPGISEDMKSFWGGYNVEFKITTPSEAAKHSSDLEMLRKTAKVLADNGGRKFRIDISKHEYRDGKVPTEIEGLTVFVYSPPMLVGEKLRAICQHMPQYDRIVRREARDPARARDFFDIHEICEKFGVDFRDAEFHALVRKIFEIKRVPLALIGKIEEFREVHRADFASVKGTVKAGVALKEFDEYFDYVLEKCRALEVLWKVDSPS